MSAGQDSDRSATESQGSDVEIGSASEALDALWGRALDRWHDEKLHAAIIQLALRNGTLPELAGRYRALVDDADRGAIAKKEIDAVVAAATTLLWSTKTPPRGKIPWSITLSAAGICLVLLAWLAWSLLPHP